MMPSIATLIEQQSGTFGRRYSPVPMLRLYAGNSQRSVALLPECHNYPVISCSREVLDVENFT
jgi:hypothetical protein